MIRISISGRRSEAKTRHRGESGRLSAVAATVASAMVLGVAICTLWPLHAQETAAIRRAKAATHDKVAVTVRDASGRDGRKLLTPGLGAADGESFRDCINKECRNSPDMVVVPAGSFMMGAPEEDIMRDADESPQHQVTFKRPFAAGKFAVTFAEWDACVADGGCSAYRPADEEWGRGDHPVINVNWHHAKAYAAWLSKKTGKTYRLLTEAEREYVTRAGTTTKYWWGDTVTNGQANYYGSQPRTVPVKSFQPNPWGFYQVHGNVWEWCEDSWHPSYTGAPGDGSAWTDVRADSRVLRGGAWFVVPRRLRASVRYWFKADNRSNYIGFRVARAL